MNEATQYILDAIKVNVWGGFSSPTDVQQLISDLLEDGADEPALRQSVAKEFAAKQEAEKSWPKITNVDRLELVFRRLSDKGVLCLHNAGYTMSDGHEDSHEALSKHPVGQFLGYCFYHGQDLERAVSGGGLMLAYDHIDGDVPEKINVALTIKKELEKEGFVLDWDGTSEQRISIPSFDWKHRGNSCI